MCKMETAQGVCVCVRWKQHKVCVCVRWKQHKGCVCVCVCVYACAGKTDMLGTEAGQQHTCPEEARDLVGVRMCSSDWEGPLLLLSSARMLEGPLCRPRAVEQRPQTRDWVTSKDGPTTTPLSLWGACWARSPMAPGNTHCSSALWWSLDIGLGQAATAAPWPRARVLTPWHAGPGVQVQEARSRCDSPWLLTVPPTRHGVRDEFWRLRAPDEPCARQMA